MNRQITFAAIACASALIAASAHAQTLDSLKAELAAKKEDVAKLERRIRRIEVLSGSGVLTVQPGAPPMAVTPGAVSSAVAPGIPPFGTLAPPPPDEETDHALEWALVREGALVLPPWTFQITPQFSYAHWDKVQEPFVSNSYVPALGFAVGLPWEFQVSAFIPYVFNQGTAGNPSSQGFGDAGFLLSKELLIEGEWVPNLVASVGWTTPTSFGNSFTPLPYVSGFQGGFTASKRFDPLVVFLNGSYFSSASRQFAGTEIKFADVVGGRVGGSLAISPAVSITTAFNVAYLTNIHSQDLVVLNSVPNSDRLLSSVDVGFHTLLWNRTLLNPTAQFGITGHTPDFRLIAAIPVRF